MDKHLNDLPLISVIVPVYNAENYLHRCVDSILNQSYQNLEIILVDDGSVDSSSQICDEYAGKDHRIRVFHKENGGSGSARNLALDHCTGEYIGFVDSDDWIEPDMYMALYQACVKTDADIVVGGRYDVDAATMQKKAGLCPQQEEITDGEDLLRRALAWVGVDFSGCDKIFRKDLWNNIRFPIGKRFEDIAVLYRVYPLAARVSLITDRIYNYYHRSNSNSTAKLTDKTFYYPQLADEILTYVKSNCPQCVVEANVLRIQAIAFVLTDIMRANAKDRTAYRDQHKALLADLRNEKDFWLKNPYFSKHDRLLFSLLLYPHVYLLMRKLRNIIKR